MIAFQFFCRVLLLMLCSSGAHIFAQEVTQHWVPESVFAPTGFDANDNAQLVLAGSLRGPCMKLRDVNQEVDQVSKRIYVEQLISTRPGCNHLEMLIPYSNVINLGPLEPGSYTIIDRGQGVVAKELGTIDIHPAASNVDFIALFVLFC